MKNMQETAEARETGGKTKYRGKWKETQEATDKRENNGR